MTSPPSVWYRKDVEGLVFPILRRSRQEGGVPCDVSPRAAPPPEDSTITAILLTVPERVERGPRDRKPIGEAAPERWRGKPILFMGLRFNKIKILLNRVEGNYKFTGCAVVCGIYVLNSGACSWKKSKYKRTFSSAVHGFVCTGSASRS